MAQRVVLLFVFMLGQSAWAQGRSEPMMGDYERDTLTEVLKERGLTIDPSPNGKGIARILIANRPVFNGETGSLQVLNYIHITTREDTMRRLTLAKPGDIWSDDLARETERVLRNPSLSSFVLAMPVISASAGKVDMLIVSRDVWSLRSNSEVIHQDGTLTFLKVAAAENNLLGRRKHLSLILEMDQGEYSLSPRWRDLSVFGTRWQLTVRPRVIYGRGTDDFEGTQSFTRIIYPLWSLASKWGFTLLATHKDAITRNFEGANIATYDDPDTPGLEAYRQEYSLFEADVHTQMHRSFGRKIKQRFSIGHQLLISRPSFLPGSVAVPSRDNFASELFPRDERSSALTLGFDFFEARYLTYRNLEGYDLPEIRIAGLKVSTDIALALRVFGSESTFTSTSVHAGYFLPLPRHAFLDGGVTLRRRIEGNPGTTVAAVDTTYGANWYAASPRLGEFQLVLFGETSLRQDVRDNELVRLGGQTDLRGYEVGSFVGNSFYKSTLELRSLPHKLLFMRVGYVAFWDFGDAADEIKDLESHHDLGLGLKALIPQTGESLLFVYWALPLDPSERKFPGRLSFGFGQEL